MKFRAFKTYSKNYQYVSIHFLPSIGFEGFKQGQKLICISWLLWAIQLKW